MTRPLKLALIETPTLIPTEMCINLFVFLSVEFSFLLSLRIIDGENAFTKVVDVNPQIKSDFNFRN